MKPPDPTDRPAKKRPVIGPPPASGEPRYNARGHLIEEDVAPRYDKDGSLLCNGHRRDGKLCTKKVMEGRTKCKNHGGGTPRGPASPHWESGRYSRALPERYRAAFLRATSSPNLLGLREQIALLDSRVEELLGQLSRSESGALWARLSDARLEALAARAETVAAQKAGDAVKAAAAQARANSALGRVFELIERGGRDREVWSDLIDTLEQQRRIQTSEVRRRESERAYVAIDAFLGTMAEIVKILREEVPDKRVLSIVSRRVSALLPPGDASTLARAGQDRHRVSSIYDAEIVDDDQDGIEVGAD